MTSTKNAPIIVLLLCAVSSAHAFYQPIQGRWLSRDAAGERTGGINLYTLVHNRVPSGIDPIGLEQLLCLRAIREFKAENQSTLDRLTKGGCYDDMDCASAHLGGHEYEGADGSYDYESGMITIYYAFGLQTYDYYNTIEEEVQHAEQECGKKWKGKHDCKSRLCREVEAKFCSVWGDNPKGWELYKNKEEELQGYRSEAWSSSKEFCVKEFKHSKVPKEDRIDTWENADKYMKAQCAVDACECFQQKQKENEQ